MTILNEIALEGRDRRTTKPAAFASQRHEYLEYCIIVTSSFFRWNSLLLSFMKEVLSSLLFFHYHRSRIQSISSTNRHELLTQKNAANKVARGAPRKRRHYYRKKTTIRSWPSPRWRPNGQLIKNAVAQSPGEVGTVVEEWRKGSHANACIVQLIDNTLQDVVVQ